MNDTAASDAVPELLLDGPQDAPLTLALAHGAGAMANAGRTQEQNWQEALDAVVAHLGELEV